MPYSFTPDLRKTEEVIIYIASQCPGITLYYALKIIYFAERAHCEKYGELITGNHINARLPDGAAPAEAYKMVRSVRKNRVQKGFRIKPNNVVEPTREADLELFSDSEIECIDKNLWLTKLSYGKLRKRAHDQSYDAAAADFMTIEEFTLGMSNRDAILRHLADPFPG